MNLRLSTISDAQLLLEWRNDELTRLNSFNSEIVSLKDHLNWFQKSLSSPNREIYIAEIKGFPIGTIRVDINEDSSKELSWTISPSQRGKGYGSLILNTFLSLYPSTYTAQIKEENTPSVKMVKKNGFTLLSKEGSNLTFIKKLSDLEIIDAVEAVRTKNNKNWMDILRVAFRHAPEEARPILAEINKSDGEISRLLDQLANNK